MTPTISQPEHVSWCVEWLREHHSFGGVAILLMAALMIRKWWESHLAARDRIEDMEDE